MTSKIFGRENNENLFLVGFVNSKRTDVVGLALIDAGSGEYSWVDTEDRGGFAGLAFNGKYLFALFQITPGAGLVVVDRFSGAVVFRKKLVEVDYEHSIIFENGSLLIVSTGTDSVLRYNIVEKDGEIADVVYDSLVWKPIESAGDSDTQHVNCMCKTSKGVYISGFGPRESERWKTARNGYVWNISTNCKVTSKPILHPHSVLEYDDDLYFCESATCTVKKNEEILIFLGDGYVRGLAVSDKYIVVGVSQSRKVSKSLGIENNSEDVMNSDCSVNVYSKDTLELLRKIDFAGQRNEIYDILSTWVN